MRALSSAAILLILVLAACGSSAALRDSLNEDREPVVTGPIDPFDDPPGYDGDPFENFEVVTGMSVPDYSMVQYEEEVLSGSHYTVQISAATTEDTADRLADIVSRGTAMPVFIDQLDGYWKVRVGAFPTRGEAESRLEDIRSLGYPDAWVTTRQP